MNTKMREQWSPLEVTRVLTDPFYTGIIVAEELCVERPTHRDIYLDHALRKIREIGAQAFLIDFFATLKEPNLWTRMIPVHPCYRLQRPAIVSEAKFVQVGVIHIAAGAGPYLLRVLDNLAQGHLD